MINNSKLRNGTSAQVSGLLGGGWRGPPNLSFTIEGPI